MVHLRLVTLGFFTAKQQVCILPMCAVPSILFKGFCFVIFGARFYVFKMCGH